MTPGNRRRARQLHCNWAPSRAAAAPIKTAVARPAQMRREHAGLSLELEDGAEDVRLFSTQASLVDNARGNYPCRPPRCRRADEVEGVGAGDALAVPHHSTRNWVYAVDGVMVRSRFWAANVFGAVEELLLQVACPRRQVQDAGLPMPAAARYMAIGEPSPPAPIQRTRDEQIFLCPSSPTST